MVVRFVTKRFIGDYDPTLGEYINLFSANVIHCYVLLHCRVYIIFGRKVESSILYSHNNNLYFQKLL